MDPKTVETRARIACRIYLALFDAGENGAVLATGVAIGTGLPGRENSELVSDALQRLRSATAIDTAGVSRPLVNVLPAGQHSRMTREMPGVGNYADRLRADLAAYDRGEQINPGAFIKTEAAIRTGYSDADPL